jgi:SAM-dependent methyltransferase
LGLPNRIAVTAPHDPLPVNLALLSASCRRAVVSAGALEVRSSTAGRCLTASLRLANGDWVPVHASEDPIAASAKVAERLAGSTPSLVIVVGLGLGYLLDALEQVAPATKVLAIEPLPAITRLMLSRRDFSEWLRSGRLTLLVGPEYWGSNDAWKLFERGAYSPPTMIAPLVAHHFKPEAQRATELTRQIVAGAKANEEARRHFAGRYLLNTIANLPTILSEGDAASLVDIFPRVPAFVVGAGPSLDRNLRELAKVKNRGVIIAVDTALRPLLHAGIRPHFVVTVDPSELNARHLQNHRDTRGVWLVAEPSINSGVFPQFRDRTFTFKVSRHQPWPWLESHGAGRGTLRAWGSVLTTAFDLACRAGCDPIIFAGADLAYTDGLQYCRNTTYEDRWRDFPTDAERRDLFKRHLDANPHLEQPDVRGGSVLTTPTFVQFRDWIVARAAEEATRQVVNATGGGILLGPHVSQLSLTSIALPRLNDDLHRRTMAASHSSRSTGDVLAGLSRALDDPQVLPWDDWLDFAGATASRDQIADTVAVAQKEIASRLQKRRYLSALRSHVDAKAATLDGARRYIHPDYEFASAQAHASQAHVLMDVLQRTYRFEAGASVRDVIRAAREIAGPLRVLDFGCGTGRTMEPLVAAGCEVDGVDFSPRMIELARQNPRLGRSEFFVSNGLDCGSAPDASYDLVCSYMCFDRIKSRSTRRQLLRAMARVLRPSGVLWVQMSYFPDATSAAIHAPNAIWQTDSDEAAAPGKGQVCITPDQISLVLDDFSTAFEDLRLQFVHFPDEARRFGAAAGARLGHLVVSGSPNGGLAARMYAPIVSAPPDVRLAVS